MVDLRSFIGELQEKGDIVRVKESISTKHELAAFLMCFNGGKALLFDDVEGYSTKVVGGICGSRPRILDALGVNYSDFYHHLLEATRNPIKCDLGNGPVKEFVGTCSLNDIPILEHFDGDPGHISHLVLSMLEVPMVKRRMSLSTGY